MPTRCREVIVEITTSQCQPEMIGLFHQNIYRDLLGEMKNSSPESKNRREIKKKKKAEKGWQKKILVQIELLTQESPERKYFDITDNWDEEPCFSSFMTSGRVCGGARPGYTHRYMMFPQRECKQALEGEQMIVLLDAPMCLLLEEHSETCQESCWVWR